MILTPVNKMGSDQANLLLLDDKGDNFASYQPLKLTFRTFE